MVAYFLLLARALQLLQVRYLSELFNKKKKKQITSKIRVGYLSEGNLLGYYGILSDTTTKLLYEIL